MVIKKPKSPQESLVGKETSFSRSQQPLNTYETNEAQF
jgi:hypothetical protein